MSSSLEHSLVNGAGTGICCLLILDERRGIIDRDTREKAEAFIVEECKAQGWYSGTEIYPIAYPGDKCAKPAYYDVENLFDSNDEYGRRRIRIAKLILEKFYENT